ncbi:MULTISPECIES: Hcp family type VI secretion system effector [Rugamonas]|uniref:Type VI secretion system secreted protein Hcp n=1 Tax=Rugamonas rubra TaxID=758825 RepID=A0A1I4TS16_9BURK|nr:MULTISPECIES: type VI secretion system tube protein TssD [Rugamonas]WGG53343.1 type VI secretion system tube protein TssD [Rugamonas sp. DEMB1]SFM79489.1 type VI secretion system secreted protein Hcp [Rugamonas rubra]
MDVIILEMPGVDGECLLKDYVSKIECLSFSHAVAMQMTSDVSNKERTSGKPNVQDFTLSKYMDKSSPVLNQACCEGRKIGDCKVTIGRNESGLVMPMMVYTLKDAMISSVSAASSGGDKPAETLTLNFTAIQWDYTAQKPDSTKEGNAGGKWDMKTNNAG